MAGLRWLLLVALMIAGAAATAKGVDPLDEVVSPQQALRLNVPQLTPPAPDAPWQAMTLPNIPPSHGTGSQGSTWFRIDFKRSSASPGLWAVYLPYLYGGGQVWFNGQRVASVPDSTDQLRIRWERPHLLPLPENLLHDGDNELMVRAVPALGEHGMRFPRVDIGPLVALSEVNDRRLFWVRTAPQLTVLACLIVSALVLFIWWRRPGEVLCGLLVSYDFRVSHPGTE